MKILILDDDNTRHKEFNRRLIGKSVRSTFTVSETIEALKNESWDCLSLDHDLGGKTFVESGTEETGYDVAVWLSKNPDKQPPQIIIHSFNPCGASNMKSLLPSAQVILGAWTKI